MYTKHFTKLFRIIQNGRSKDVTHDALKTTKKGQYKTVTFESSYKHEGVAMTVIQIGRNKLK